MILISIQPFAIKKFFGFAAAVVCLSASACFADAVFLSGRAAPQQRQVVRAEAAEMTQRTAAHGDAEIQARTQWTLQVRLGYGFALKWADFATQVDAVAQAAVIDSRASM